MQDKKCEDNRLLLVLAQVVSILFHPLLSNIYAILLLFAYTNLGVFYQGQMAKFLLPVFLFSFLIPLVGMCILKMGGYITDFSLSKSNERPLPLFVALFSYICQLTYFNDSFVPGWFLGVLLIPILLVIICYFINRYIKISLHMISIGAMIGASFSISYNISQINPFWLFAFLFIISGLVGTSRLILKRHTPYQIYLGFLIGFSISYLTILLTVFFYIIFSSN